MDYEEIIKKLESLKNPKNVAGMARFGIRPKSKVLGIPIPETRKLAKIIGKNNDLAMKLFDSGIHEARILAGYIAEPEKITKKQFEKWVKDFDSWDVVDQVCSAALDKTSFAYKKIFELSKRKEEFEKRTAFTLICCLTVHDKKMPDKDFIKFFPLIKEASIDERNFVKKAVNWALRQIGKRNKNLNKKAIKLAKKIQNDPKGAPSKSAKWIANDAIRELTSEKILKRIENA
ncbi:MAG: DNA alkylation repair protein [Candidatus Staskawiczbacteria bacterium]|nr:DNA alkylation repair protein [Candidatus Staskawiczbacteria bacterium]